MPQPKRFLYFLTTESGATYRVNNGFVEAVGTYTPLPVTPDGWQDKSVRFQRNPVYHGIFRSFTNQLKFVKQGARILRDRLYKNGMEEKIYLVILMLDTSFGGEWKHKLFYKGELDLSQTTDEDTNVTTSIMEGDLNKLLKANENTPYELDVNVPEAVTWKADGTLLKQSATWKTVDTTLFSIGTIGMIIQSKEGADINGSVFDEEPTTIASGTSAVSSYFFLATGSITLSVSGSIVFTFAGTTVSANITLAKFSTEDGSSPTFIKTQAYSSGGTFTFDETITLSAGEKLQLRYTAFGAAPSEQQKIVFQETDINLNYDSRPTTVYRKAFRPKYVAQKLIDKITGGGYTVESTLFDTTWNNLLITSGDAIRGITNAKLKTSLNDFLTSYNVPCNLCMKVKDKTVYIEKKESAFNQTVSLDYGEVRNMRISPAKDYLYNAVKIGYPDVTLNDTNGKQEFNTSHFYTSPVVRYAKTLELVSVYKASCYDITFTQAKGATTTNGDTDNAIFFIHVETTETAASGDIPAHYALLRRTYDSITGLIAYETVFNLEISPKRCLLAHGNFLRGVFYWQQGGDLVFQSSDKNADVKTTLGSEVIYEKGNVNIGELDSPLFIPLTFQFESKVPNAFMTIMQSNPDNAFRFYYDGDVFEGFVIDAGVQPANRPAQESTLLCSPTTDINQLIVNSR